MKSLDVRMSGLLGKNIYFFSSKVKSLDVRMSGLLGKNIYFFSSK